MKLLVSFRQHLSIALEGREDEKEQIIKAAHQLRIENERIEAKILERVQSAVLEALPEFTPKTIEMCMVDEDEPEGEE